MVKPTASEAYAMFAAAILLLVAIINRPPVTLGVAAAGLIAGAVLARRGPLSRAGMIALAGFAAAGALGAFALLR
jgi:hypothetical protein